MLATQDATTPSSLLPDPDELIPQARLGRELFAAKLSPMPIEYMTIWRAIASGKIEVEPLGVGGRGGVRRKNLRAVAAALNLPRMAAA